MTSEYIVPAATVVTALLALAGVFIANKTRKPVGIQDLWQQNAALMDRVDKVEQLAEDVRIAHAKERAEWERERRSDRRKIEFLSDGFGVLYRYMQRVETRWGDGGQVPILSADEKEAIEVAMAIKQGD